MQSTYDITRTYQDNYDNGPFFNGDLPSIPKTPLVSFLGKELNSTLGIPAGPLLNERYTTLYARLGFDILTYKTVRSVERACHPAPNCVYLPSIDMKPEDIGTMIHPCNEMAPLNQVTITNSFGMPSKPPGIWQADLALAVQNIGRNQMMIASVVGTADNAQDWVRDIAYAAAMAKETGVQAVELDISCPNVNKNKAGAGSVYLDPEFSAAVSKACKYAIGNVPLLIKVGYFSNQQTLQEVLIANAPYIDGVVAINTISREIRNVDGSQTLSGEGRATGGACGRAIKPLAQQTVADIIMTKNSLKHDYQVIGCGGVTQAKHFNQYYRLGCDAVVTATGAMWNPYLAYEWLLSNNNCLIR